MRAEKEFLIRLLKEAGVKSAVYTSMKKLKAANEMHLGAVLVTGESFIRSRHRKAYTDKQAQDMGTGHRNEGSDCGCG